MSIFDAAVKYANDGVPLVVLAGKEYGSGSSRDWAAKGPKLLGVRVVIAESYERIHRCNLVGMGILPLQFLPGESAEPLGLTGEEVFETVGPAGRARRAAFAAGRAGRRCARTRADGTAPPSSRPCCASIRRRRSLVLPARRHPAVRAAAAGAAGGSGAAPDAALARDTGVRGSRGDRAWRQRVAP